MNPANTITPATLGDQHSTFTERYDPGRFADTIVDRLVQFALDDHAFPNLARTRAVDAITDCIGCMLAGSRENLAKPLLKILNSVDSNQEQFPALMLGTRRYACPADAALYNGAIAHALDYDDTNHPAYAHPSAVLVPALLALAPICATTGSEIIDSYLVGFEIFGKLGRAMNTQHYKIGWHATSTFGTLAAAVAAGRMLKLSHRQMKMAIGIAVSSASGFRANFGSMTKPLHAGYASRNGVLAALLSQEGFDANDNALEHKYGYLSVLTGEAGYDPEPLKSWGKPLEILTEHGLALKPYPSCGATHPGIEAALQLHDVVAGAPISHVRIGVCEMAFEPLIHITPHSPLEGKFSLHYCVAVALLHGNVNLQSFTSEMITEPGILDLISRTSMTMDSRLKDDSEFATEVTVQMQSGERHTRFVPLATGKPDRWFTSDQMRTKFEDCCSWIPEPRRHALYECLRKLDDTTKTERLMQALVI